ncbi:hypothetical protein CU102_15210 [Phyllobacterium brassicacearum]|uniref:Peptidase M10 serralysin C-terminal domain-containing protein n=2 Tax=Phyllobacterium brassicacearum TaxID=314235 RepID=A0A2P7BN82_9HYPH|nr:hypothetical protein CU102_15210 [Phyllobacterium brassicacearum]
MDQIDGGEGTDTIDFLSFGVMNQSVVVDMAAGTASGGEAGTGETFRNIENIDATPYDDVLRGDGDDNVFDTGGGSDQVDGGGGTDTAVIRSGGSVFDTGLTVDLATGTVAGGYSDGSTLTNIENVSAGFNRDILRGDANDNVLYGNDGADTISGGAGNDTIIGGIGAYFTNNFAPAASIPGIPPNDTLSGGLGADVFVFRATQDSDIPRADVITDFSTSEGDRIDLSTFHADYPGQGDPIDLTFIGYGDFSGEIGELRLVQNGTATEIQIDVNGDEAADFLVKLAGVTDVLDGDIFDL